MLSAGVHLWDIPYLKNRAFTRKLGDLSKIDELTMVHNWNEQGESKEVLKYPIDYFVLQE
jgi:hypothetical protein